MWLPTRRDECEWPRARARPDHGATTELDNAIEDTLALPSIVQYHQCGTAAATRVFDDLIHQFDALRVEIVVRLVEEQQAWRSEDETGQCEPALHARREPAHSFHSRMGKANALQYRVDPRFGDAEHAHREEEVLGSRQVLVQTRRVRQKSDVPADLDGVAKKVVAMNPSLPCRRA